MTLPPHRGDREQQKFSLDALGRVCVNTYERRGTAYGGFFTSATLGSDLSVNGAVSGTPDGIHNGTDSVLWTASALSGTWDFASTTFAHSGTKSIDATGAGTGKEAQFQRASSINLNSYTVISAWIYIVQWDFSFPLEDNVSFRFRLNGVDVGATLPIGSYLKTSLSGTWQKFSINLSDFSLPATPTINQLVVTQINSTPPTYYLDDIQLEETGGSERFIFSVPSPYIFHLHYFTLAMAAPHNTTLANAGLEHVIWNELCGQTQLDTGILFRKKVSTGQFFTAGYWRNHLDGVSFPGVNMHVGGNATSMWVSYDYRYEAWPTVDASIGEEIDLLVADDLSGFHSITAIARGHVELA